MKAINKKLSDKWSYDFEERQAFTYAMQDSLNAKNRDYYASRTPRSKEAIFQIYDEIINDVKGFDAAGPKFV